MSEKKKDTFPEKFTKGSLSIAEAITGFASSKKEDVVLSVGHLIQGLIKYELFGEFAKEWQKWKEKGKIKEDYEQTDQYKDLIVELFELLEKETPVKEKMKILNRIFIVAGTETLTDRNGLLPLEYLKIAKNLRSGEILILNATYRVAMLNDYSNRNLSAIDWLKTIADESTLKYPSLIESFEPELIKKKLITKRTHSDESGVVLVPNYRLTDLGFEFCKYVNAYDKLVD